jgi:hypothetical protein
MLSPIVHLPGKLTHCGGAVGTACHICCKWGSSCHRSKYVQVDSILALTGCYNPELSGTLRTTLHHQQHRVRSVSDPHDILRSTRSPTELLILQFCIGSYCMGHIPNWGACYDRGNTIVGDDRPRCTTKC